MTPRPGPLPESHSPAETRGIATCRPGSQGTCRTPGGGSASLVWEEGSSVLAGSAARGLGCPAGPCPVSAPRPTLCPDRTPCLCPTASPHVRPGTLLLHPRSRPSVGPSLWVLDPRAKPLGSCGGPSAQPDTHLCRLAAWSGQGHARTPPRPSVMKGQGLLCSREPGVTAGHTEGRVCRTCAGRSAQPGLGGMGITLRRHAGPTRPPGHGTVLTSVSPGVPHLDAAGATSLATPSGVPTPRTSGQPPFHKPSAGLEAPTSCLRPRDAAP